MKDIYILIGILITISCKAQSPIINIEDFDFWESQENAYYKDINNYFNDFEGTWLYTNGNTSFKIVLQKKVMSYTGKFYKDAIIGEYQYIENGVEKINTLPNFNQLLNNPSLWGSFLLKNSYRPICNNCSPNERRLKITLHDLPRALTGRFTLKKITINGQPALEGYLWGNGTLIRDLFSDSLSPYNKLTVPTGTYIFIKQ
tara:strand:- start:131 stop:733 length:603 start_codon:yes stop_codon:yes gene_type:complete